MYECVVKRDRLRVPSEALSSNDGPLSPTSLMFVRPVEDACWEEMMMTMKLFQSTAAVRYAMIKPPAEALGMDFRVWTMMEKGVAEKCPFLDACVGANDIFKI